MNIFVYSDESGVMDKKHNKYFVFGGVVFLSKEEKDNASHQYVAAEKNIRKGGQYKCQEIKASTIRARDKRKLYRLMKDNYRFAVVVDQTSVYKGYKRDKIEMRGDRAEMSDFPLYLNTVAGGLDRRDQTIGGFSFVVKIYAVPVVEIIG